MSSAVEIQQFPCSSCGAKLEYSPGASRLKCPYCGSEEDIPDGDDVEEIPYESGMAKPELSKLAPTAIDVSCPGCRASITFVPPDIAGKCPFCGTGIVAQGQTAHPVITPGGILPAKVSAKEAKTSVQRWLNSRWFAPTALRLAQKEGVQGVYLPFWTCDSQTYNAYSGQRGDYYYRTVTVSKTNSDGETEWVEEQVRETSWHNVSGQVDRFFDDILVVGTTQIPAERLQKLEPWDLTHLVPYSPAYMAGFKAQRAQVAVNDAIIQAKQTMNKIIESDVRHDIGGDEQRIGQIQSNFEDVTYKHILMPVWMSAYRYRNKQYQVMVNAQTGQVLGDRPWSVAKIAVAVVTGLLVIGGGIWLANKMQTPSSSSRRHSTTRVIRINQNFNPGPVKAISKPRSVKKISAKYRSNRLTNLTGEMIVTRKLRVIDFFLDKKD
jgi:LSD1 subclass zinc finger protein